MNTNCTLLIKTEFYSEGLGGYGDSKDEIVAVYLDEEDAKRDMQILQKGRTRFDMSYSLKLNIPLFR